MKQNMRKSIHQALIDKDLQAALQANYPLSNLRKILESELIDFNDLTQALRYIREKSVDNLPSLIEQFKSEAARAGVTVFVAKEADDANNYILQLAQERNVKRIVKSKSMVTEEISLNDHLEKAGIKVTETDIGAWLMQLAHEKPVHMIKPDMNKTTEQLAALISKEVGEDLSPDPLVLVDIVRRLLKQSYLDADMGISGANVAIAETGTLVIVTNEGNECMVTSLPPIHVAVVGIEKIVASPEEADNVVRLLAAGYGRPLTHYVSYITGPSKTTAIRSNTQVPGQGPSEVHIVLIDNGRSRLRESPDFREALYCIKCGRCLDVCPVFSSIAGHVYGDVYQGGIGIILTAAMNNPEKAAELASLCTGCMACKDICSARIDIPAMVTRLKARMVEKKGLSFSNRIALRSILKHPKRFATVIKTGSYLQKPFVDRGSMIRRLPYPLNSLTRTINLPAISRNPLSARLKNNLPDKKGSRLSTVVFAGCVVNYAYPSLGEDTIAVLREYGAEPLVPKNETCCGAPAFYKGDIETTISLAKTNIAALEENNPDYIVTLCPGCAGMLKRYPELIKEPEWKERAKIISGKVRDFSQMIPELPFYDGKKPSTGKKVTYHDPCHLKRGLGIFHEPRQLLEHEGFEIVEMVDADACCGFGNDIVLTHPELSNAITQRKLDNIEATGVDTVVTSCAPCILQLRGGLDKRKSNIKVLHIAELLEGQKRQLKSHERLADQLIQQ